MSPIVVVDLNQTQATYFLLPANRRQFSHFPRGTFEMNKLFYYIAGVGLVFTIGFSAVQQHSKPTARPAEAHPAKVRGDGGLASMPFAPAGQNAEPAALPTPPHLQSRSADLGALAQPSPEDVAMQDEAHAEMIASMRANHLPEDQITRLENEYAAKKQNDAQPQQQDQTPMAERSTTELAAELEQSMRQSGAPEEQVKAMVQALYAQADDSEAAQANAQLASPDAPPMHRLPPPPH